MATRVGLSNTGAGSVVLAADTAHTVFLGIGEQGLTVLHVLCNTVHKV